MARFNYLCGHVFVHSQRQTWSSEWESSWRFQTHQGDCITSVLRNACVISFVTTHGDLQWTKYNINPFCQTAWWNFVRWLTFENVEEILYCDHSNESSMPVLLHGAICFSKLYKMKFGNLVEICLWLHLAVKGLRRNTNIWLFSSYPYQGVGTSL